ncbi:flagella basal body P-ring formation protein FlgA [Rhodanobacter sp. ANJX3]|uniref:flagellar basal body P-ring formation chaperone FlgA n=1 Tax=unclassified Rhodanobacter TaxID=2621553 RepID=UPI0015CCAA0E|nr:MULTISPECIES: flagellar basal body P-ring formation chaperone FlgA [unclassified Rhodanobacter]MBB5359984.1 flagella basal body P-ring formation protein FlgA [Rhodanobacter sp. ANJX3]NYE28904.1 flagella basal body P-ring formation protein FlgA [Rhodanobacter sp. K2T2]
MTRPRLITLLWVLAMTANGAARGADMSSSDVRTVAEQAVRTQYDKAGTRLVIVPQPLNPRLRLAPCPQPLLARLPTGPQVSSRVAVSVSCPTQAGWTIRVPVQMQVYRQVLVTTRPLARGDSVGAGDVHSEERDVTRLGYGYVESLDQVAGRSLARPLSPGTVLQPGQLNGREMVRAGDQVELIAQLDGIEVRTTGQALDGGDTGTRLRVRNGHSGLIVPGVVLAAGEVKALP